MKPMNANLTICTPPCGCVQHTRGGGHGGRRCSHNRHAQQAHRGRRRTSKGVRGNPTPGPLGTKRTASMRTRRGTICKGGPMLEQQTKSQCQRIVPATMARVVGWGHRAAPTFKARGAFSGLAAKQPSCRPAVTYCSSHLKKGGGGGGGEREEND
jgi:hypothetical protein